VPHVLCEVLIKEETEYLLVYQAHRLGILTIYVWHAMKDEQSFVPNGWK
jgi:hypothetical protein